MRRKRSERDLEFFFFFSPLLFFSNKCFLVESVLTVLRLGARPLFGARLEMGAATFGFFRIVVSGVQLTFYLVASGGQLTPFPFSITHPLLTRFPFESSSANKNSLTICCRYISIFNLGACCYYDLDFGNLLFSFLFVSPFSYMVLFFLSPLGGPVNLASK